MSLRDSFIRIFGRQAPQPDVTTQEERAKIRERLEQQEIRLRSLDAKAGLPVHRPGRHP
jgi:hypothetical protein